MLMFLKQERDHGTPARTSDQTVQLEIDGYSVSVPKGTSLMRAAVEAGIQAPNFAPPTAWSRLAHAVCVWWKSRVAKAFLLLAPRLLRPAWWYAPRPPSCKTCAKA